MLFPPRSSYRKMLQKASGQTNMRSKIPEIMKKLDEDNRGVLHFSIQNYLQGSTQFRHQLIDSPFSLAKYAIAQETEAAQNKLTAKLGEAFHLMVSQLFSDLTIAYAQSTGTKHPTFRIMLDSDTSEIKPKNFQYTNPDTFVNRKEILQFFNNE